MKFTVPKQQAKSIQTVSEFLGADFTNSPANIDMRRSPNCKNMIRDVPGKVRKSMGWEVIKDYGEEAGVVNGAHWFRGDPGLIEVETPDGSTPTPNEPSKPEVVTIPVTEATYNMEFFVAPRKEPLTEATYGEIIDKYITDLSAYMIANSMPAPFDLVDDIVERTWDTKYANCPIGIDVVGQIESGTNYVQIGVHFIKDDFKTRHTITSVQPSNTTTLKGVQLDCLPRISNDAIFLTYKKGSADSSYVHYLSNPSPNIPLMNMGAYTSTPTPTYSIPYRIGIVNLYDTGIIEASEIVEEESAYDDFEVVLTDKEYEDGSTIKFIKRAIPIDKTYLKKVVAYLYNSVKPLSESSVLALPSDISDGVDSIWERFYSDDYAYSAVSAQVTINNYWYDYKNTGTPSIYVTISLVNDDYWDIERTIKKSDRYEVTPTSQGVNWQYEYRYVSDEWKLDWTNSSNAYGVLRYLGITGPVRSYEIKINNVTTGRAYYNILFNDTEAIVLPEPKPEPIPTPAEKEYKIGHVIHVGEKLYFGDEVIYEGMNDARSKSWQFGDTLYIIDGKQLLTYTQDKQADGTINHIVKPATEGSYIPTLTISKNPDGGGTPYESLNLLNPGFTEQFYGKETAVEYSLSFKDLDATPVTAKVLNANGEWIDKVENTDFTVNRATGVVTFTTAPGKSPVDGEDNIKITAYKTVSDYADRINKCSIGILYGVGGSQDRLFLSGNPDYANYDWFSEQFNPQYFADTSYSRLGSDKGTIIGYSIVNNYLATHKDDMDRDQNIIMRNGAMIDNTVAFRVVNSVQGAGALAKDSFAYLSTEPLFLTSQGVFAVTSQDVTGEKYVQNRSYFLNGKMLKEDNLENAYACVYNDMYWLCVNDVCYILDGLQAQMTDKSMPYSTRQYAGFYRTNVPANIMWVKDNRLWFGTRDGKVCRFFNEPDRLKNYNDNGEAIEAIWETPDLDGQLFFKNKTLRYLALRVESAIATSVKIYAMNRGLWEFVKEDNTFSRYFSYANFMYSKMSYSADATQKISRTKMRIKKVDKFRLKFVNDKLNEPLGIYDIGLEMVENGNFKG